MAHPALHKQPECQAMFELFASPRGKVSLGRLSTGNEAGRIVVLREISEGALAQVTPAFEFAKGLAHPRLLKLLGVVSDRTRSYIASEYVPGLSLFELVARARARQQGMEVSAAVRVMIDALRAVVNARSLLLGAGAPPVRLLNSDCVWLVDYGETLLSEAGVSAALGSGGTQKVPDTESDVQARDVMTAAVELYQLCSGRLMTGDLSRAAKLHLPSRLAQVLEDAFSWEPSTGADGVGQMADALAELPAALIGSETLVASELQRLCGDLLEDRRRKLAAFHSGSGTDVEGATRIFAPLPVTEEAEDEATVAIPGYRRRGVMQPVPQGVPESVPSRGALDPPPSKRPHERRASPQLSPPRGTNAQSRIPGLRPEVRERWLVAFLFMLALGAIGWQRRAWLNSAMTRLRAWKAAPASHRPASGRPIK